MNLNEIFKCYYAANIVSDPNYALLEPHRVQTPPGYLTFNNVATGLRLGMQSAEELKAKEVSLERSITTISTLVINSGVPVYYVKDLFARAIAATSLPGDLRGKDFHWPHQGFVLGLSDAFLRDYLGIKSAGYIYVANMPIGEYQVKEWTPTAPIMSVPIDKFGFFYHREFANGISSQVGAYVAEDIAKEAPFKHPYVDLTGGTPHQLETNKAMTEKVGSFVIKLMAILNTNKSYITTGSVERPEKRHKQSGAIVQHEVWSPNFIGKLFSVEKSKDHVGTHASPRYHRREGHFTHQRIGIVDENFVSASTLPRLDDRSFDWSKVSDETRTKFWACHERIWIPPLEVNA